MLTLATTIGESPVAGWPLMVCPDARENTIAPSRTTVIDADALPAASRSNAPFAAGIPGLGSGSRVVVGAGTVVGGGRVVEVVDVVDVVEVVVVVVVIVLAIPQRAGAESGFDMAQFHVGVVRQCTGDVERRQDLSPVPTSPVDQ